MTFDFVFMAQRDAELMKEINDAMASPKNEIVYTDIHKLSFFSSKQTLIVEPSSANSSFYYKVVPKVIKYSAVRKMLENNWEICDDEIMDVK